MKKLLSVTAIIFGIILTFSQAPEKFSYQAVIRNASNALITNATVGVKISILKTSAAGTVVYAESQTPTTNINGLMSIQIGAGTVISGSIAGINWGIDSYYIKAETDPAGGTDYTIAGTTQLLSVPYALYSKNSGSGSGLTLPYFGSANNAIGLFQLENTGSGTAIEGTNTSTASNIAAVVGAVTSTTPGGFSTGVRGINNGTGGNGIGVWGSQNGSGYGVYGTTPTGYAVYGVASTSGIGVYGSSSSGTGLYGTSGTGNALSTIGSVKMTGIGEGFGKILTSDTAGNATWQDLITPDVHFSSLGGSVQSVASNSPVIINSWTGLEETGGANYNATTGEYTIPVSGFYSITSQVQFGGTAANNAMSEIGIFKNGFLLKAANASIIAGNRYPILPVSIEGKLVAGDKIKIYLYQSNPTPLTLQDNLSGFGIHLIHK